MTTQESIDAKIKKEGFKKGLILGGIVLALNIFSFYFITSMVNDPVTILVGPYFFTMIIPLAFSVFFAMGTRKNVGGYLSFRQAVTAVFVMFFTSFVILIIGRDLLFIKLVEPNMLQKTEAAMIKSSEVMYKKNGFTQIQIKSRLDDFKKSFDEENNMSFFSVIGGYITIILFLFVLSLGLASILKKVPPALVADR